MISEINYHYDAEYCLPEFRIERLNHSEHNDYVYNAFGRRIEKHRLDGRQVVQLHHPLLILILLLV